MFDKILQDIEMRGWSYQENFLEPSHVEEVQRHFSSDFTPAKVGSKEGRQRNESIRGDWTKWIDVSHPEESFLTEINFLLELKQKLNERFFLGLKEFECHLARYPAGSFYRKHLDRFESESSRVVSFIFYLNESWGDEDGGELVLYQKDHSELGRFLPRPGSFVCFISEDFPHEVLPSQRERRSLTGWMHNKIIS
jgi:SM-20-related protein